MMTLTILDFLVGEEINIFLSGIKIERMHAQHTKWNSQIFPLVVTVIRKRCILSSLHRQWSVLPSWEKVFELPADQKTDLGISCSSFITFSLASYTLI